MMNLAIRASLFSAIIGTLLHVNILYFLLGSPALIISLVVFPVAFSSAFIMMMPLIKLRERIKELSYFLVFLMVGIFAGVVVVNVVFQQATVFPANFYAYGAMGAVCSISGWFYLRKWGHVSIAINS